MTLDLDTTPLTRGLIAAMAGWFLSLGGDEQKEQPMNEQPHDAIAAARRVSVDEIARIAAEADRDAATMQAIEAEANMALFDERLAAAINSIDICRAHGGHHAWTSEHSAAIRSTLATFDALIAREGSPAPQRMTAPALSASRP